MSDQVTAAVDAARTELADGVFPTPEDVLSDLNPLTQLFYVQQMVDELNRSFLAMASATDEDQDVLTETVGVALQAITMANGELMAAGVALGLFPPDATT